MTAGGSELVDELACCQDTNNGIHMLLITFKGFVYS